MTSSKILLLLLLALIVDAYDEDLARRLATMSYASYCNPLRLSKWDTGVYSQNYPDVEDVNVIQSSGNSVLVYLSYVKSSDHIIVAFRGSANLANWISNLQNSLVTLFSGCGCKVHKGFLQSLELVKPEIYKRLDQMRAKYTSAKVSLTGHSLGGAMATLLAADMYYRGYTFDRLYTYGSPRIGDPGFWNWFETFAMVKRDHFRITNFHDPVPHIPTQGQGFYHINQEVYYENGTFTICSIEFGEDAKCIKNKSYNLLKADDHGTYLGIQSSQLTKLCQ